MEPVQLAKLARESLIAALNAIQSSEDAPDELFDVAEPIAQTITILRKIERSGGTLLEGRDVALKNVRRILAEVQNIDSGHPAADEVLEAIAASLSKVNALAKGRGGPSVPPGQPSVPPPQPSAPPPQPSVPPPAVIPKAAPVPAIAPRPEPVAAPAPRPAQHFDEPRHRLDARIVSATPLVAQAKPVVAAHPEPVPVPQPVIQPKPVVDVRPVSVPQPVVQAKPIEPKPPSVPPPAPQPVAQAKPIEPKPPSVPPPAPQPVAQAKPIEPKPPSVPPPALQPVAAPPSITQAKPVDSRPQSIPPQAPQPAAAVSEPKPAPKKVAAPPAPPGVRTLDVSLGTRSVSNFYRGLGGNDVIDHGGVFVETYQIPRIGTQVQLHVHMPGDYEFYALATVMWTRETGGSSEPGFGARFTQIGNDGRQLVYRYSRIREPMFYDDL